MFDQAEQEIPHTVSVTPEEQEVIERVRNITFTLGGSCNCSSSWIFVMFGNSLVCSFCSWKQWVLTELSSLKLFWLVIAMRNWLQIICWSMQEITKINWRNPFSSILRYTSTDFELFLVLEMVLVEIIGSN